MDEYTKALIQGAYKCRNQEPDPYTMYDYDNVQLVDPIWGPYNHALLVGGLCCWHPDYVKKDPRGV